MRRGILTHAAGAWTLIETLVALTILAVVLALSIPALARVAEFRRELRAASQYRQHAQTIAAHAASHADLPPAIGVPPLRQVRFRIPGRPALSYFLSATDWSTIAYANLGTRLDPALESPWLRLSDVPLPDAVLSPADISRLRNTYAYRMTCSLFAVPAYWNRYTRSSPVQWRLLPLASIRFPASKILLVDFARWEARATIPPRPMPFAMADGSVTTRPLPDINPGYRFGDGDWTFYSVPHAGPAAPGQHTIDGTEGRDW